jgi:hypothetical protein
MSTYPRIVRGPDVEVGRPVRGRPSYAWVAGWVIEHSPTRQSMPMRRSDALHYLRELRAKPEPAA